MVCEPLVPLMMWMLSPAVILAWTSVELLVPGITMSETNQENYTYDEEKPRGKTGLTECS